MRSKKLRLISVLVCAIVLIGTTVLTGFAFVPTPKAFADTGNYYSSITASNGIALLGQIHDLIVSTHTYYTSYDNVRDWSIHSDPGPNGGIIDFYTHESVLKYSGTVGTWNREHVWPQSLSAGLWGTSGGGSDMHHIRPCESKLNGSRGNKKYGDAGTDKSEEWSYNTNGGKGALGGYSSGNIFEPLDNVKGDVSRIIMYVYTHYNNARDVGGTIECSKAHGKLQITNVISASSEENAWKMLLQWNKLDPVDDIERQRNEWVFSKQHNRNPFIDNESYADAIWGDGTTEEITLQGLTMNVNSLNLAVGGTSTLSVNAIPSNANNSVTWTSDNSNVARVDGSGKVTAVNAGSAVITATSTQNSNIKATATVTVKEVNDIQISGTASKLTYSAGQKFNPAGLSVTAIYSDGTSATLSPSDVQWLDADTGQSVLLVTTTKIKCKYGAIEKTLDITVTVTANPNITKFTNSVAEIEKKTTLQAKFIAIKQALADYNALSSSEKQEMADVYKVLKNHISEYNQAVNNQNAEMDKAANFLAETLVKTMPALLAIAYIVTRKMY